LSMVPCSTGGIMLPVGAIIWFASTSAPIHCWPCDGASHLAIHAPELFSVIGYTFGGSMDHFNVPDLRRRFIRGYDVTPPQIAFGVTSVNDFTAGQNGWLALAPYIVYESV
jgi:microcystin-dependent protein